MNDHPLRVLLILVACAVAPLFAASDNVIKSPNERLAVTLTLNADGAPRYAVELDGRPVLAESRLGLVRDDADFSTGLRLLAASPMRLVEDRYEILTAKRRANIYRANRRVFSLQTSAGRTMDVIFQVSDDGVAFRYYFPLEPSAERAETPHQVTDELSSFHFMPGTKAWLQPMAVAKTGWESTNPSYEEHYLQEIPASTPSPLDAGWVYPALFRTGATWLLISESALGRSYAGTRLRHASPDGEYTVGFPDPRETMNGEPVTPSSALPWLTPWRLIVVGSLKTIAESTLGIDLAEKPAVSTDLSIRPGKASWSWPLLGDPSANFDTQKQFIDYAADMGWAYCLIDAWWDQQIGYEKTKELVDYARGKNVELLLWYNSSGDWNGVKHTPKGRLLTRESRLKEFDRLQAMGIRGLKIDFFGGDGQAMINYYHDLLTDTAPYGFLLNFHGATLPRGWQRTYPHLMTVEAIRGLEFITFEQEDADREPTHAAMLPFTRNVFDPMDFTPMVLDRINDKVTRRTTSAFELALSVLFTSGIQHYAEVPAGMAKVPDYVREFLRHVPSVWDDVKFLDGYPGKFAVLARRGDSRWYVAGINGEATARTVTLDLHELGLSASAAGTLITDGGDDGNLSFERKAMKVATDRKLAVTLSPHGGFVLVLE